MTKEERRLLVATFLEEYGLALPPKAIYRNLRLEYKVTFSLSTLRTYLEELAEQGLIRRVEPEDIEEGKLINIPLASSKKSYYIICDQGREYVHKFDYP